MKEHRQARTPVIDFKKDIVRELLMNKPYSRSSHYLEKAKGQSRRCVGCYKSISKKLGATLARKQTKQVVTRSSKCNKHYYNDYFSKNHKKNVYNVE